MRFIIGALIIIGIVWLLIFLGTVVGLIGLMVLRILIIFGIPAIIIVGIYKLLKR